MNIGAIVALICIAMAFIAALVDEDVIFNPLGWLVAAIAFAITLGGVAVPWRKQA